MLKELGKGAMSTVFLARDEVIGRLVALKTFRLDGADKPDEAAARRRRMVREARSAGRLSHPNVVTIYDIVDGGNGEGFYIAMEYVQGSNLAERLAWSRPFTPEEILDLVSAIAGALDHFHSRGVIHRDIKPANILLAADGAVKVTDFGIARDADPSRSQDLTILGTPQYMSPEQVLGRELDRRSDVFALGVLLYELFTRARPFPGATVGEVTHQILHGEVVPPEEHAPELPAAVAAVIRQALSRSPDGRFPSAGALARVLAEALGRPLPTAAGADPLAPTHQLASAAGRREHARAGEGARPRRWLRLAGGLAAAAALVLAGFWLAGRLQEPPAAGVDPSQAFVARLVSQGQALLGEDPEAAVLLFRLAEPFAADPAAVAALRLEAEGRATEQGAQLKFAAARQAMAEGRYDRALASARQLLATEAGHERAVEVLVELEELLASQAGAAEAPAGAGSPGPSRAQPPAADGARLAVELDSQAPRGVLILYAGETQIYRQPFHFFERTSWFRREPRPGTLRATVEVPPDQLPLRVLVARRGEAAQSLELAGTFRRGSERRLLIRLPAEGRATAELQ